MTGMAAVASVMASRYARRARREASRFPTPGALARAINPKTVQTEALDLIDAELVRAYRTPDARLIISMPPQEGKSERVTKTGTLWALRDDPDRRFALASYAQPLAEGFSRDIRNWIISNNGTEGTLDIGLRVAGDNGAARRWQLAGHRGGVVAVGIKSGLTGRPVDALVIDDPYKDQTDADSPLYRESVWNWWLSVGSTRLAPGAPVILVLTRWHEDDLAGRLLAGEDGHLWRVVNIPALADHDPAKGQVDPLGREPGTWLRSARRRTIAQWEAIRVRAGTRVFTSLYQGRPSPASGNVWKRHWWRRYETLLWSVNEDGSYRVTCDELILSWDMAFKDTKSSDFVVGQVWARKGASVYLLDQVHKRLSFTDTLVAFQALVRKWPQAKVKLVEDKANGTAVISTLQSKIPGIIPENPTDSKYGRATAVAPFVEAGNVFLPSAEVALFDPETLIEEAAAFPNGSHDDQVDAASQALNRLLLDGTGAAAWTDWLRQQVEAAAASHAEPAAPAGPDGADLSPLQAARQAAFTAHHR